MTCLRMALGSDAPSLLALRDGALKYGACTEDVDGTIRGLVSVGDGCRDTAAVLQPTEFERFFAGRGVSLGAVAASETGAGPEA
ncbi:MULTISPECIES: hypothetical protein [Streptomyces]|uniref:hypothetical protein n=1 Tax=Streptomyces TaxID=1883 RepID=UPI000A66BBC1|nr:MULTISPECIES: hypothetical protein [unclassified Streptomyces]UIZ12240.1 hypothetical protein LZ559_07305 [Streptomyces sp. R527F]